MANHYVSLNGKRYLTARRDFAPKETKAQQINVTLGGKTASQSFGFTDYRWSFTILVQITPDNPAVYGSRADLQTAYGQDYVTFVDVDGNNHEVFMLGELPLAPHWALVDPTAHFEVPLQLRKRQT